MRLSPHLVLALTAALLTTSLPAQEAQPPASTQPETKPKSQPKLSATITGTVLCADTRSPARGATVLLAAIPTPDGTRPQSGNGMDQMGRVAMDGTYTLAHVAPGEYTVVAILPGYLSALDDYLSGEMNAEEKDTSRVRARLLRYGSVTVHGSEAARFDVTLQRGASVSGRVLYSDGSPATQITLDIQDANAKPADTKSAQSQIVQASMFRTLFTHQSNATDDLGHFRVSGIKPGTYRVAAISSQKSLFEGMGGEDEGMGVLMGFVADATALRVYSGDTLHQKSAKTYELRASDDLSGIDIIIPLNAFHRVQGTLAAQDGHPINAATLTLTDAADDTLIFTTRPNQEGLFTFPAIPSGTYNLAVKTARILSHVDPTPNMAPSYTPDKITGMFADASMSILVKDSDLPDVTVALTEIPIPANANQPSAVAPDRDPDSQIAIPQ